MLGLLRPCLRGADPDLVDRWRAHMCGVCLTLRDRHGQWARATLNTDAIAASVLLEAQQPLPDDRVRAGRCALRGMRTAQVIDADSLSVRLGATTSVTLAAAKAVDEIGESDLALAGRSRGRAAVARRAVPPLLERVRRDAAIGAVIDSTAVIDRIAGQAAVESRSVDLDEITAATEYACAEVFASTADLAGRPENREILATIGAAFGRCGHLVDAVEDLEDDRQAGAYNLIDATGVSVAELRTECRALHAVIADGIDRLRLRDDRLTRAMLVRGLHHSVTRAFGRGEPAIDRTSAGGLRGLVVAGAALCALGPTAAVQDDENDGWCAGFCRECCGDACSECCCDSCCDGCCDCS